MRRLRFPRQGDLLPAIAFSLVAHLLVLGSVVFTWSADPELASVPEVPSHVRAVVMEKPAPKPKPKPKPEPRPKPEPKPEAKTPVKKQSSSETAEKPVTPDFSQPDMAELLAREELEMAASEKQTSETEPEQVAREGDRIEDNPEVGEYIAAIRSAVARRWTRPPSARNGMRTVLRIRLLPGGEVLDVSVIESSGDGALDRSTVAAVKNASPLPVPSGEQFNENFRVFSMGFQPEDLRL